MMDPKARDILFAYVTFRSMDGLALMKTAFEGYPLVRRIWVKTFSCCLKRQYQKIKLREFDGKFQQPVVANLPDNIQW